MGGHLEAGGRSAVDELFQLRRGGAPDAVAAAHRQALRAAIHEHFYGPGSHHAPAEPGAHAEAACGLQKLP